ncbi:MAG: hypothetical protein MJZ11_03785 [Lachnospiraceae bacterium]|nr:hypothetical protein [Lachnospiraceae bacterium]
MKFVYTDGKRNELKLTYEQRKECLAYVELLGFEHSIDFSEFSNTAFVCNSEGERYCRLIIGTDVYPNGSATNPNEIISYKGAIAHEIVGHYEAWLYGFECDNRYLDEAQASIRAARFAPFLSFEERVALIKDGLIRLKKGNIKLSDAKKLMHIEER